VLHNLVAIVEQMATTKRNKMLIGYARVSKIDQQDTRPRVKAPKEAGCKRIFEENASGGRWECP
jgi:predicted site-specific integrase-resolvase